MSTPFHAKYWATELTLRGATGSIEALSRSIAGARVDLNPHQVDAALFALRSPLARGVILADEVGLGKTIEAGIVLAQRWAERRRRILLIVPATLRSQWQQELASKFFLPTCILDGKVRNERVRAGQPSLFGQSERIVICSYNFVAAMAEEVRRVPWDLVVIDEAHRLRNVFRTSSKLARSVVDAVAHAPKLLLTATPLQNSLMELYGLASVVDEHLFGDAITFRERYVHATDTRHRDLDLRQRLQQICIRTLRKQVVEYVSFTRRIPLTQSFVPSDDEHALYECISAYLLREDLVALPASQRTLITLVLRKLLASSTFAIADTLDRLVARLQRITDQQAVLLGDEDLEGVAELGDDLLEPVEEGVDSAGDGRVDPARLAAELAELRAFAELAHRIRSNAKGEALIQALDVALARTAELGAKRKAVVFTESRRTQRYLFELLTGRGYQDQVVLMNGSNQDAQSNHILDSWRLRHAGDDQATGSKAVDMKSAIVEHFREQATILIATEAAAEGVNLQFCSLVVNFDLPWNPQRIEQRIGRCHRYGQQHDVVVVNFLNERNQADQRVLELLSEKFKLFDGVFGASDEVLGAIESGVDIERRIAQVFQTCRSGDEIKAAFDRLQADLDEQIQARMAQTREVLLENFDADVSERLRIHRDRTLETLSHREQLLLALTRAELAADITFDPYRPRFRYSGSLAANGWYHFDWKQAERLGDTFYRQDHPLAAQVIEAARTRQLQPATLHMDYAAYGQAISVLKPLLGSGGWLEVSTLRIESLDTEEFLVFATRADSGQPLDEDTCRKLLLLPATVSGTAAQPSPDLGSIRQAKVDAKVKQVEARNGQFFDEEVQKLDRWSDDLKQGLERELKDLDQRIREARRACMVSGSLQDKLTAQQSIKALEALRSRKRRDLFEAQDAIDGQRDVLIQRIEQQLQQRHSIEPLFLLRWQL